jgi:sodium/potassium-transporting ATPase subunit alpha
MYFGFTTEIILIVCLAYIIPLNVAFGTRDVIFVHFGVLGMPFGLILIIWNEARRFLVKYIYI